MRTAPPEVVPKLGLHDLSLADLPKLEVIVRNSKGDVIGDVVLPLTALIVSPATRVLYLEAACTSDSGAHALMGAVSDPRGAVEFRFCPVGSGDYIEITPPESPRVANVRLAVNGWSRHIHHVAMLDRSGDLILAPDDGALWRKLREKMTCPTLEQWGRAVMPEIHRSRLLLQCEAFGVPPDLKAYVLAADAAATFDTLIAENVRTKGLLRRTAA